MKYLSLFLLAVCLFSLPGCAKQPPETIQIISNRAFKQMTGRFRDEFKARGIFDASGSYTTYTPASEKSYGQDLFERLSPAFIPNIKTSAATFEKMVGRNDKVRHFNNGFIIESQRYTITVFMAAITDWDLDKQLDALILCYFKPRQGRSGEYYIYTPFPLASGIIKPRITASYECLNAVCTSNVRDSRAKRAIPQGKVDKVTESVPGLMDITSPPDSASPKDALSSQDLQ